tara:strand:+ start:754 stop:1188 length:435 start_codon:yes stop_codon:yes gene_type:complete
MKAIKVIFHHFENDDEKKRMNYVYRLVEKGYKSRFGHIYIHAANEEQAKLIDDQLWTFRQESFIPHSKLENKDQNAPISIGCDNFPDLKIDVIINLSDQAEDPALQPKKIHEIVPSSKEKRSLARIKWKAYKGLNYAIKSHKVN